jgi:hypothetical protein
MSDVVEDLVEDVVVEEGLKEAKAKGFISDDSLLACIGFALIGAFVWWIWPRL